MFKRSTKLNTAARSILSESKKIAAAWSASRVGTYGASVAYYAIFSIAPLLVIAISITGLVADKMYAQTRIISEFQSTFGYSSGELIKTLIESQVSTNTNIVLSIVGFVVLLIGATGVFSQLQQALDAIFESLPQKARKGFWRTVIQKVLSVGMVLSIGFLLLLSLAASTFITYTSSHLSHSVAYGDILGRTIEITLSFVLVSFFFALVYKVLPSERLSWRPAVMGGSIAGILFTLSKYILGLYLGSGDAFTAYGAASSLVLLIIWIYYMSLVFFFGAIMIRLYFILKAKTIVP